ncbi:hypothetical protein MNBD_NITROSPINAE04-1207 [hydrothermal vent metagenome]|uniref:Negative regulator of flagellin synthesis n=1 Tax=hydrothermal vent metagenome TaxID=652676 RepID=A0A3B1BFS2_9ZZZZ
MKITGHDGSINQSKIDGLQNRDNSAPAKVKSSGRPEAVPVESRSSETVAVSTLGREIGNVKALVKNAPDIRREKIEALKEKIAKGEYEVSGDKIAGKIIEDIIKQNR